MSECKFEHSNPFFEVFSGFAICFLILMLVLFLVGRSSPDFRVTSEIQKGSTNITYTVQKHNDFYYDTLYNNIPTLEEATNILHTYIELQRFPAAAPKQEYTFQPSKE